MGWELRDYVAYIKDHSSKFTPQPNHHEFKLVCVWSNLPCGFQCHHRPYAGKIENYCIQAYLSFIQHKSLEITCSLQVTFLSWFDIKISFKYPKLIYPRLVEMHQQQTYRKSSFYVGCIEVRSYTIILSLSLSLIYDVYL